VNSIPLRTLEFWRRAEPTASEFEREIEVAVKPEWAADIELEGNVDVIVIQTHGLAKLISGGFAFTDFEERIGKVLANGRSSGRGFDGFLEESNRVVVIPVSEVVLRFGQRGVGRIGDGC
jgi:hypothetical protein